MNRITASRIFRLAFPLILQQLCLQLQLWIDRAMLGHVNAEFFSAIGNTTIPYQMVVSVIIAICGGTTILVAQNIGAKDLGRVTEVTEASFIGNSLLSVLAFLAGGINVIYSIEQLPLMTAILIHGGVLYIGYLGTYLLNDWLDFGVVPMIVFTAIFVVGYIVIWAVIYSAIRRKTARLNEMLKKQQQNQ